MIKRKTVIFASIIALLMALLALLDYITPNTIRWEPTYSNNDSNPYGTKATFECLQDIFKEPIKENNQPIFILDKQITAGYCLILADTRLAINNTNIKQLLSIASRGNSIFIFTNAINQKLTDTLKVAVSNCKNQDTISVSYLRIGDKLVKYSSVSSSNFEFYNVKSNSKITVLGYSNSMQPNFISIKVGKGRIFLHSNPLVITNYNLLYGNSSYIAAMFKQIPDNSKVIWDQYYNQQIPHPESYLKYIYTFKSLSAAYYTLLIITILYIFGYGRRRQKAIPMLPKRQNISLDFIKTIGRLYYQERNNADIAKKKISYFFDRLYTKTGHRFGVESSPNDRQKMAYLLSCPIEDVDTLYELIALAAGKEKLNDKMLLHIDAAIRTVEKNS